MRAALGRSRGACDHAAMTTTVDDAPAQQRYEVRVDGTLAGFADYVDRDGVRHFTHTEIFPDFGGQGIGSALIRGALDAVRARGATLVPECSFVADYIAKHPDDADLVA
jgi:uncharacterized protein